MIINGMHINEIRDLLIERAKEGRATFLPAGARHSSVALVYVDGELWGEASMLMPGGCRREKSLYPAPYGGTFQEVPIVTHEEFQRLCEDETKIKPGSSGYAEVLAKVRKMQ